MNRILLSVLGFLLFVSVSAHPWKPDYYVIVDTDCGFDDLRALSLMIASPEIRVLAITTSNGVLDAKTGYMKVKALLNEMHHEGLLVGASSDSLARAEGCIPAMNLEWGIPFTDTTNIPTAVETVDYVLSQTADPVTFVSLGSLHTADMCMRSCSHFSQQINRIIWSSESPLSAPGFNYELDTAAFWRMQNQPVPIYFVHGENDRIRYDPSMSESIAGLGGIYASRIAMSTMAADTFFSRSFYDEIAVLYMHFSDMFTCDTLSSRLISWSLDPRVDATDVLAAMSGILEGTTVNQNQVLSVFPIDTGSYFDDVNEGMTAAIARYGKEEWIANTLTAELHRHLGVYASIGVKMGIRTREYFGAGIDELNALSYAGTVPPYSCLNDGIQVSTGATIGHGLIRISQEGQMMPCADFTYLGQTVRVALKEEYRQQIEREISEYNRIYGLSSDIYWELVRIAAIKYWQKWDRYEIFDITQVSP